LDSTHYHTAIKGTPKGSKTHIAPLKFGVFYPIKSFVKIDLPKWLDKPFLDDDEIGKFELQLSLF